MQGELQFLSLSDVEVADLMIRKQLAVLGFTMTTILEFRIFNPIVQPWKKDTSPSNISPM